MREFFFPLGCLYVQEDLHVIRIRHYARTEDQVALHAKAEVDTAYFKEKANLTLVAVDPSGKHTGLPELPRADVHYEPWIDVVFVGATSVEHAERDGKKGLLVRIGGSLQLHDPEGSWPFTLAQTSVAEGIRFICDEDVDPHWPLSE